MSTPPDPSSPTITGVRSIDSSLARLEQLDGTPVEDHAATYEQVHSELRTALDKPERPVASSATSS